MCHSVLCYSREKKLYLPQGGLLEIPRGIRTSRANIFKGKYELKLEF